MAEKKSVAERVMEIAVPVADELGIIIWDVFFGKEGRDSVMRITIDKEGGVGIADCEALSRAVDPLIDEAELTSAAYSFQVQSPGLGRRIKTDRQFEMWLGKPVIVKLLKAGEDNIKEFSGVLSSTDADSFTVTADGKERTVLKSSVASVKADDDIDF